MVTLEHAARGVERRVTGLPEHQEEGGVALLPGDVEGATQVIIFCVRELSQEFDMWRRSGHVRIF